MTRPEGLGSETELDSDDTASPIRSVLRAHQELPRLTRTQWLAALSLALIFVGGRFFTLPPGPLCDEGMVLFMEGGCDWGPSNVFFFSKLGLLVALNVVFVVSWLGGVTRLSGFLPHFAVALALALSNLSGGRCDTYYDHPNGNLGQMILEVAAFAFLGLVMLRRWQRRDPLRLAAALLGWNLSHVVFFYAWLALFPHWTWGHTALVVLTLLATAGLLWRDGSLAGAAEA